MAINGASAALVAVILSKGHGSMLLGSVMVMVGDHPKKMASVMSQRVLNYFA